MDVRELLEQVKSGGVNIEEAEKQLKNLPYEDLGYAKLDHHRKLRSGFGETVFCQGKPDAYLLGAQLLGLAPQECVVVEDAPAGVLSGLAAGCHVIAVNAPADTPRLADVDFALDSLTQLSVAKQPNGDVVVLRKT